MDTNTGSIEPLEGVVQINNSLTEHDNVKVVVQVKKTI